MIQEHIEEIEAKLRDSTHLPEATRTELLNTLAALKAEILALAETHGEHAETIVRATGASAEEATREQPGPGGKALEELTESVAGFETSHPGLVATVNRLAVILSNMGM